MKDADTAFTHHNELKSLIIIIEKLISYCEKTINARNKVYKVYFNSQALLKMIYVILLMFDQKRLQKNINDNEQNSQS